MRKLFLFIAITLGHVLFSQVKPAVALTTIREADVMWAKDIWRIIDLRERINFPFYFPIEKNPNQLNLFNVILAGIDSGAIKAYKADEVLIGDTLTKVKAFSGVVINSTRDIYFVDEFGNDSISSQWMSDTLSGEYIAQYWIKEKWFFDKQRSVMDVRIISICPVKYDVEKDMYIPLFWLNYNETRKWFAQFPSINAKNYAEPLSFDELFLKRKFVSVIKKESNIYNREIAEYVINIKEFLQESDRILEFLRNFEADRWEN